MPKDAVRARGVLMVKHLSAKLNFWTFYKHRNVSIHRYIVCLHEIETQFFKIYLIGRKNRLDPIIDTKKVVNTCENMTKVKVLITFSLSNTHVFIYRLLLLVKVRCSDLIIQLRTRLLCW